MSAWRGVRLALGAALTTTAVLWSLPAAAEPLRLQWRPEWQRFDQVDVWITGVAGAVAVGAAIVGPNEDAPYRERNRFDEGARDALRAENASGRVLARDAADVLLAWSISAPVLIDGIANAGFYRQSPDVARQLVWIDLEAAAISAAITGVTKSLVSRERPYGRECGAGLHEDGYDCIDPGRYYSFFSGHSNLTFTAATVSCVSSRYVPLWGAEHPLWPCIAGYGVAATTAVLRIAGDQHYASDITVGAVIGTGVGFLVPWLHFEGGLGNDVAGTLPSIALVPLPRGAALSGVF